MRYRRNADYDLGLCVDCGSGLGPCKTALDNDIEECEEFTCNKCGCDTFKCEWVRRVHAYLDGVKYFSTGASPNCGGCDTEDENEDEYDIDIANEPSFSWSPCEVCNSHLGVAANAGLVSD